MTTPQRSPADRGHGLGSRVVAGTIVACTFAACVWADAVGLGGQPPTSFLLPVAIIVAAGAGREAVRLSAAAGIDLASWLVPLGAVLIAIAPAIPSRPAGTPDPFSLIGPAAVAGAAVVAAVFVDGIRRYAAGGGTLNRVAGGVTASIAIGLPLAFMVALRLVAADACEPCGAWGAIVPLVSLIAVVKAGDIAAYAVGSAVGRHRMAPVLSPGKTWEGASASLAASVAVAWLVIERLDPDEARRPLGGWPAYGLLVGGAGMVGDLAESLVKRELGAKDSGRLLGGMGGWLDLVDSLLAAAPVAWLLWALG